MTKEQAEWLLKDPQTVFFLLSLEGLNGERIGLDDYIPYRFERRGNTNNFIITGAPKGKGLSYEQYDRPDETSLYGELLVDPIGGSIYSNDKPMTSVLVHGRLDPRSSLLSLDDVWGKDRRLLEPAELDKAWKRAGNKVDNLAHEEMMRNAMRIPAIRNLASGKDPYGNEDGLHWEKARNHLFYGGFNGNISTWPRLMAFLKNVNRAYMKLEKEKGLENPLKGVLPNKLFFDNSADMNDLREGGPNKILLDTGGTSSPDDYYRYVAEKLTEERRANGRDAPAVSPEEVADFAIMRMVDNLVNVAKVAESRQDEYIERLKRQGAIDLQGLRNPQNTIRQLIDHQEAIEGYSRYADNLEKYVRSLSRNIETRSGWIAKVDEALSVLKGMISSMSAEERMAAIESKLKAWEKRKEETAALSQAAEHIGKSPALPFLMDYRSKLKNDKGKLEGQRDKAKEDMATYRAKVEEERKELEKYSQDELTEALRLGKNASQAGFLFHQLAVLPGDISRAGSEATFHLKNGSQAQVGGGVLIGDTGMSPRAVISAAERFKELVRKKVPVSEAFYRCFKIAPNRIGSDARIKNFRSKLESFLDSIDRRDNILDAVNRRFC